VRVTGWHAAPDSGAQFKGVKTPRDAERLAEEAQHAARQAATTRDAAP
jgi:hypothetical protein